MIEIDTCVSTMSAPTMSTTTYSVEMFETFSFSYNAATFTTDCGTVEYTLFKDGTSDVFEDANNVPTLSVIGDPTHTWGTQVTYSSGDANVYIGSYDIELYAAFASPYESYNARSATFTLTVTDPCVTSISQSLSDMYIHLVDSPSATQSFTEYTDEG